MGMVTIELPESVLTSTGQSREQFVREAKIILTAKLFEEGKISSGKGAEICGMARIDFLLEMGRRKIATLQLDEEELNHEFKDA